MSRYIDADALIAELNKRGIEYRADINEAITNAPSIDIMRIFNRGYELGRKDGEREMADLVRCAECKYITDSTLWMETSICVFEKIPTLRCKLLGIACDDDGFCNQGERRE